MAEMLFDIGPPDTTPDYMWPAWEGCLRWALGKDEILNAFRAETGNQWHPGRTPIDRMIDKATGVDREFMVAFVAWFNENVWGDVSDLGERDG